MSRLPAYHVDPDDPRAPSQEVWDTLTPAERAGIVDDLPYEFPLDEAAPPEGDPHFEAKAAARNTLRRHFRLLGRSVYLACELPVYYPAERMFAPDVIAILDVPTHQRLRWVVSDEGKGLALALEILYSGRRHKDVVRNRAWYARLGIPEYFIFDRKRLRLSGYRLASPGVTSYEPILPQAGYYRSSVLGLELAVLGEELRFFSGAAALPDDDQLVTRLETMVQDLEARRAESEEHAEEEKLRAEEEKLRAEGEVRRRAEAERRLAEALAELERLKGPRT